MVLGDLPMVAMHPPQLPAELSVGDIEAIVTTSVSPHTTIRSARLLPVKQLQTIHEVNLLDGTKLLVTTKPPAMLRLLRYEQLTVASGVGVIRWLREEALPSNSVRGNTLSSITKNKLLPLPRVHSVMDERPNLNEFNTQGDDLVDLFPVPVPIPLANAGSFPNHFSTGSSLVPSFELYVSAPGTAVSCLLPPLSSSEQMAVDYQAGTIIRRLARITPPSGKFGPAVKVLHPRFFSATGEGEDYAGDEMTTWSAAFHSILESILRDGEDAAVALDYSAVRKQFQRFGHLFDAVTTPCLVIVDAINNDNLLVQRFSMEKGRATNSKEAKTSASTVERTEDMQHSITAMPAVPGKKPQEGDRPSPDSGRNLCSSSQEGGSSKPLGSGTYSDIAVTGFHDLSHCIFGDPLFAPVFCEQPSKPFLEGFFRTDDDADQNAWNKWAEQSDEQERAKRLLLYRCYHAIVRIVAGFYHPTKDQSMQELAARKQLTGILAELDALEDEPKNQLRHRRPSGDMSPAKRPQRGHVDRSPKTK